MVWHISKRFNHKMELISFVMKCSVLAIIINKVNAVDDVPTNGGKEFIFGIMEITSSIDERIITATLCNSMDKDANVHISTPMYGNFNVASVVKAGACNEIEITIANVQARYRTFNSISSKGILVTSDVDISVSVYCNDKNTSSDMFLVLPTNAIGTEYYVSCYKSGRGDLYDTQFLVVGVYDDTYVRIKLPDTAGILVIYNDVSFSRNQWINITMHKYDTLTIQQKNDLSGTNILADKPISVFSGNMLMSVVKLNIKSSYLVEQLIPVHVWGKSFIVVPVPYAMGKFLVKIIGREQQTTIFIQKQINDMSSNKTVVLSGTHLKETIFFKNECIYIHSDKRILVVQIMISLNLYPSMAIVPALEHYIQQYSIPGYIENIMFVVKSAKRDCVLLNGSPLPNNTVYQDIFDTDYIACSVILGDNITTAKTFHNLHLDVANGEADHSLSIGVFGGTLYTSFKNKSSYYTSMGFQFGNRLNVTHHDSEICSRDVDEEISSEINNENYSETTSAGVDLSTLSTVFNVHTSTDSETTSARDTSTEATTEARDTLTAATAAFGDTFIENATSGIDTPTGVTQLEPPSTHEIYDMSTTDIATETAPGSKTTTILCQCDCEVSARMEQYNNASYMDHVKMEATKELKEIIRKLSVNLSSLSSYRRRKSSASDNRTSSTGMGYMAAAILTTILVGIIILDMSTFYQNLLRMRRNIC